MLRDEGRSRLGQPSSPIRNLRRPSPGEQFVLDQFAKRITGRTEVYFGMRRITVNSPAGTGTMWDNTFRHWNAV